MAHIVEADDRIGLRVGGTQGDAAARLRQVVADMHLEAMALGGRLAVVADGDGKEVILDVGLLDAGRRAKEGAGLELVGGTEPGLEQHPLRARHPLPEPRKPGIEGDRLQADLLEIELHVILKVGADARAVGLDLDAHVLQVLGRADARQHQELRGVERGSRDDHLAVGLDDLDLAAALDFDADGAAVLDDDPAGRSRGAVRRSAASEPASGRRWPPTSAAPATDGLFHQAEAFLLAAVVVVGRLETRPACRPR